jgi:hypothetical protein
MTAKESLNIAKIHVAVSLRKAKCIHNSVMFCSVVVVSVGGSADGGRDEKMSHW